MNRKKLGDRGEDLALRYLAKKGYTLVERNYRTRKGEIDLIMRDKETLVFVEVKLRQGTGFGHPLEAVTPRKQVRIRFVAEWYLAEKARGYEEVRFDVVGILLGGSGKVGIRHVEDAF